MDLVVFSPGTQVLVDLVGPDGHGGLFPRHSSSGGPGGPGGLFPRHSSSGHYENPPPLKLIKPV
jgi:hypothetical protein